MSKPLTFTIPSTTQGLTYTPEWKQHEKELRRLPELFNPGDPIPFTLWQTVSTGLAEKTRAMMESLPDMPKEVGNPGLKYTRCSRIVLSRYPFYRYANSPWLPDKNFGAVRFIAQEADSHADA